MCTDIIKNVPECGYGRDAAILTIEMLNAITFPRRYFSFIVAVATSYSATTKVILSKTYNFGFIPHLHLNKNMR